MKKELDDKLCKEFPLLYSDRHASMQETCMCWGFCCGDGWFDLIYRLSQKLEAIIGNMPEDQQKHHRVSQVKEKFGTLRFYMRGETKEMSDLIREAHKESARTCEECGCVGSLYTDGWWNTLCEKCAKEHGRSQEDDAT
jgi:hypothetical protein